MLTIDGLASGIDTTSIIEGLLGIQQQQIDEFSSRKTEVGVEQAAFAGLETQMLSLRNSLTGLTAGGGSAFRARAATSSNENLLTVAASSSAPTGNYQVTVNQLAQSHQIASQGFADKGDLVTQGDLEIQIGNGNSTTVTIDSSNNTLEGMVEAINRSDADVTATIINDGSASPYRIMLTANSTGGSNDIRITNNLGATGGGETQPTFDLDNPIQDPLDAVATLGSGSGAISVSSSTNQLDEVVPGVTLNLLGADVDSPVNVSVAPDSQTTIDAATKFVESYNALMKYIDDQSKFTPETETAGPLLGNRTAIRIQDDLRLLVTESVGNLNPNLNRMTAAGFSFDDAGRLSLNEGRLRDLLEGNVDGVDDSDVARLFTLGANTDNNGVNFVFGGTRTQEGDVQVDITSVAESAQITAGAALAATTVIDDSNNSFTIKVDGNKAEVSLAAGSYTGQELADLVEGAVNSHSEMAGREVQVSLDSGAMRIQSLTVGSKSEIEIIAGEDLAIFGFSGGENDRGQDVVGTFIVNGQEETATGNGRLLVGDADNEFTADLQVRANLTASQLGEGPEATLSITRGVASKLDQLVSSILDPVNGRLEAENDRYDSQIESIDDSIDRLRQQFEAQQESLVAEFVALESTISELQNTGNFLAAQFGGPNLFSS